MSAARHGCGYGVGTIVCCDHAVAGITSEATERPCFGAPLMNSAVLDAQNTAAKSLLYECIHTMTLALPYTRKPDGTESKAVPAAVRLCSEHLRKFTEDPDQNLKYLVSRRSSFIALGGRGGGGGEVLYTGCCGMEVVT